MRDSANFILRTRRSKRLIRSAGAVGWLLQQQNLSIKSDEQQRSLKELKYRTKIQPYLILRVA
jgi:hypothetical protein